jgi:hypothetical protein
MDAPLGFAASNPGYGSLCLAPCAFACSASQLGTFPVPLHCQQFTVTFCPPFPLQAVHFMVPFHPHVLHFFCLTVPSGFNGFPRHSGHITCPLPLQVVQESHCLSVFLPLHDGHFFVLPASPTFFSKSITPASCMAFPPVLHVSASAENAALQQAAPPSSAAAEEENPRTMTTAARKNQAKMFRFMEVLL